MADDSIPDDPPFWGSDTVVSGGPMPRIAKKAWVSRSQKSADCRWFPGGIGSQALARTCMRDRFCRDSIGCHVVPRRFWGSVSQSAGAMAGFIDLDQGAGSEAVPDLEDVLLGRNVTNM